MRVTIHAPICGCGAPRGRPETSAWTILGVEGGRFQREGFFNHPIYDPWQEEKVASRANPEAHQEVIRDEMSAKRASECLSILPVSKLVYRLRNCRVRNAEWMCMRTCLRECVLISTLPFAFPRIGNRNFPYCPSLSRLSHPHSSGFVSLANIVFSVLSSTSHLTL